MSGISHYVVDYYLVYRLMNSNLCQYILFVVGYNNAGFDGELLEVYKRISARSHLVIDYFVIK